jgi:threonine dehydratase
MAEIKLESIKKSYGRTEVIHGADFEIARRRVHRHRRSVGLRQVHDVAHDRGA